MSITRKLFAAMAIIAATLTAKAETATLEIGDYTEGTQVYDGSTWENAPFCFHYKYSGGQLLFPSDLLSEIADKGGNITSLTFRCLDSGNFFDIIEGKITIYAQMVDATKFEKVVDTYDYIEYDAESPKATFSLMREPLYYENDFEMTFSFDTPVAVEAGKTLLLTTSGEMDACADSSFDFAMYSFDVDEIQTAFFSSDTQDFASSYAGGKIPFVGRELPVMKVEYDYTERLPQAETPVFAPAGGSALGPDDAVAISCATEGAEIFYTLSGDNQEIKYTEPVKIEKACTITAVARKDGFDDSEPAKASYTLKITPAPVFEMAAGGELGSNERVVINATEGAEILYTLSEGIPDLPYPTGGISLSEDATVKACAVLPGHYPSDVLSADFTVSDMAATVVGDYYAEAADENLFAGSNWYNAPIIPTYNNSASQLLYLPEELDGLENCEIRVIKFRYYNGACFDEYVSQLRLYINAVDNTDFNYDETNKKYRWYDVDLDNPAISTTLEINFLENYTFTDEITFELPGDGFLYTEGKALVITVVNEADNYLDTYPQFFKYSTDSRRAATFVSDKLTFSEAITSDRYVADGEGFYERMTDRNQPSMKIFSVYKKPSSVATAVSDSESVDEYYNLQGVRVTAPTNGLYIRRSGDSVTKVLVK